MENNMKIVLFALNGSYAHTSLAVRCLRGPLERAGYDVVIIERSLRDRSDEVLQALYGEHAALYGFSAYIWNITEMLSLAEDLKALLPDARIVFGGPEVSYDTARFDTCSFIDSLVIGEGEDAMVTLADAVRDHRDLPGKIDGGIPDVMKDEGILYRDGDYTDSEMLYYESSRGCPYHCAYCLSSESTGIRAKSVEQTLCDLEHFETLGTKSRIIKFVDRTFNFHADRANRIWAALADERFTGHYHFEICASLLNEESFRVLSAMPKGKIQLEIGLQSTNPETLAEVSRHIDPKSVIEATRRIHDMGNIHVHLDLIAGLPYESYERFRQSFSDAYDCCDMLQLGFLKLLHGTRLRRDAEKYGYVYSAKPPYTILQTAWMSRDELFRLSEIADLLDRYYSSGSFARSLACAVPLAASPFDFYEGLLDTIKSHSGVSVRRLSQVDAFRYLYDYVCTLTDDTASFEACMHTDFASKETRRMPLSVIKHTYPKQT